MKFVLLITFLWLVGFGNCAAQFNDVNGPPFAISNVPNATVVGLPVCNASRSGLVYLVTNALLPTVLSVVVGGGSVQVLVHCNGTSWVVG